MDPLKRKSDDAAVADVSKKQKPAPTQKLAGAIDVESGDSEDSSSSSSPTVTVSAVGASGGVSAAGSTLASSGVLVKENNEKMKYYSYNRQVSNFLQFLKQLKTEYPSSYDIEKRINQSKG